MVGEPVAMGVRLSGGDGGAAPRVVCTVGMHRSGTSLISGMLNLLGVHLGPDERISPAGEDNRKGYWEHRSFVDINDEILARFGGRWDEPPSFPPDWPRDPRLLDLRERARLLVATDFAAAPLWGWKDPRTCLTLPFWQDVVGPMRYVVCVRHPAAVVASLVRRNGIGSETAQRLSLAHLQAGLAHTSGQPRLFVFYEDVLDDWRKELWRLAAFVGDPDRAGDPRVQEAVRQFVDDELCHHRASVDELVGETPIAFPTAALYLAIRGVSGAAPDAPRILDLLGARALETWDRTTALAAERDRLARETGELAASLTSLQERLIRESQEHTAVRDALKAALDEIHASRSWRLVLFIGRALARVLPAGSRRRRVFDALLDRIAGPRSPRRSGESIAGLPAA